MASGVVSGVPCTVLELTMIQQQRMGGTLWGTPLRIIRQAGLRGLFRGFIPACNRECFFTAGYLGVSPALTAWMTSPAVKQRLGFSTSGANFVASCVSGVGAAALTHPMDTIKSCMQGDLEQKKYTTFRRTAALLYTSGGIRCFYRGFVARSSMICMCFLIFNEIKMGLAPIFFPSKFGPSSVTTAKQQP
uniref:Mitochondrial carrier protein n=1 Tax=Octactis speculum TaxID=3111310 RepID=A0A7S2HMR7_9STRA|mmetsp:Transcript_7756/g.9688  ORF Transcript_7756/g.9688 Transcript_7756/m.9688 type:complete len:190 (+) Transcript_7756:98-667(+)